MRKRHRCLGTFFLIPVLAAPALLLAIGLAPTAVAEVAPRRDPAKAAIVFVGDVTHPSAPNSSRWVPTAGTCTG